MPVYGFPEWSLFSSNERVIHDAYICVLPNRIWRVSRRPRKLQHAISQRYTTKQKKKKTPSTKRKTSTNSFCVYLYKNYIYICMHVCLSLFPSFTRKIQNSTVRDTAHFRSLVNAHEPISSFGIKAPGEISKSKMSIGMPIVVQAFGIYVCQKGGKKRKKKGYGCGCGCLRQLCRRHGLGWAHTRGGGIFALFRSVSRFPCPWGSYGRLTS